MRKSVIAITTLALCAGLTGCGASYSAAHDHNAPTATNNATSHTRWHWLDSPGSFATIIYTCVGTEGYYETPDQGANLIIVPQDPICGYKGSVTTRVYR